MFPGIQVKGCCAAAALRSPALVGLRATLVLVVML
jgi:hypothetical protein